MKTLSFISVSALLLLVSACGYRSEETATKGGMHVLASESQAVVMHEEVEQFMRLYADAKVTLGVTTTRDAIVQLLNDSVRYIVVDRDLNAEEKAVAEKAGLELEKVHVAEDALAFIVHPSNPLTEISEQTLRGILGGEATEWKSVQGASAGGAVQLVCTGRNSGTYELLVRTFFKLAKDAPLAAIADSQRATVDFVAAHPGALGVVPVSAIRDTALGVRVLKVEALDSASGTRSFVALHQANIYLGKYPYHYPVYVHFSSARTGLPMGFSAFMASPPGQKLFQNAGLVPRTQPVRLVQLNEE
ncbi:MAG: substrate-binding domain-containing protein [Ignavibacteria bacterium]|nr:substrate-binding domain-containing protein [Ignavibacteria bacterium]